jgi:hypothetical protein
VKSCEGGKPEGLLAPQDSYKERRGGSNPPWRSFNFQAAMVQ